MTTTAAHDRKLDAVQKPIILGTLPVKIINAVLNETLEVGDVRLSVKAHAHIARDHPEDYPFCMQHMADTIQHPTYVGKAPEQWRNFEMVKTVGSGNLLVAVGLELGNQGDYHVKSAYCITTRQIQSRLMHKHLFPIKNPRNGG